jgi:medium-chain acyl-[acyl-carrier-protein] hydrolase
MGAPSWITPRRPRTTAAISLFCFPYAGGGPSVFRGWERSFPPDVELLRVALPGRELRFGEPLLRRVGDAVAALAEGLAGELAAPPFAFFGHSLGALLAFELARDLKRRGATGPVALVVSGCRSPTSPRNRPEDEPIHHLPDPAFQEKLRELAGTPEEVLESEELMGLFRPLLRADFEMADMYVHEEGDRLECPIVAFAGTDDGHVPLVDVEGWATQTSGPFRLVALPGNHFFLHDQVPVIAGHVVSLLRSVQAR